MVRPGCIPPLKLPAPSHDAFVPLGQGTVTITTWTDHPLPLGKWGLITSLLRTLVGGLCDKSQVVHTNSGFIPMSSGGASINSVRRNRGGSTENILNEEHFD